MSCWRSEKRKSTSGGKHLRKKVTLTLTTIAEVTVSTRMHELRSDLVGGEVGGSDGAEASLRVDADVPTCVLSVVSVY